MYNYMVWGNMNIYPEHMDKKARAELRGKLSCTSCEMYCGCSAYSDKPLAYGISSDLRFIPLHHGYVHSPDCVRKESASGKRSSAYVLKDDGTANVFLKFNPFTFTVPKVKEDGTNDEEETSSKKSGDENDNNNDDKERGEVSEKEPFDDLAQFIFSLNNDTYNERFMSGKGLLPADYFHNSVLGRLKKVYFGYMDKPVKEVNLQDDGVSFFYSPLLAIEHGEKNTITLKGYSKDYNYFMFPGTMANELKRFEKRYGITIDEAMETCKVMAAGMVYLRMSKAEKLYRVVGRIHYFIVNDNGLYCRNLDEMATLNNVNQYVSENYRYRSIRFNRITESDGLVGSFTCEGKKQVLLCVGSVPNNISESSDRHEVCVVDTVSMESLLSIDKSFGLDSK